MANLHHASRRESNERQEGEKGRAILRTKYVIYQCLVELRSLVCRLPKVIVWTLPVQQSNQHTF